MTINKRQFETHLFEPESSFEILIRGHLWTESLINQILAVHMTDSSALDIDRMGFRQKVDIAQAFGFISPEDGRTLRELNRLRNKLAHDLSAEPSESDIQNLLNMPGGVKAVFDAVMVVPDVIAQNNLKFFHLRYWFFSCCMHLEFTRAMTQYEKDNSMKLAQVLAFRTASEKYAGKEITEEEARRKFNLADPPKESDLWR